MATVTFDGKRVSWSGFTSGGSRPLQFRHDPPGDVIF